MAYNYLTGGGTYRLASSISSTQNTIKLSSFKEPVSGTLYTMAYLNSALEYATIDPETANSEFVSFTGITQNADGTATLTGVVRGLARSYPYTTSSTFKVTHSGQSIFILSNAPQIYNDIYAYIDALAVGGAVPATTSVLGISKLSYAPVSAPSPIVVGDNDPRLTVSATSIASLSYPVGSIYMSVVSTNPNTLFGFGTWSAIGQGRVLIGAGTGTVVATFASRSSNVITVTGLTNAANNEFQTGQAVLYSAPSGAMTGLTHNTTYYLVRTGNLAFSLATTLANAQNATVISLSSDGTGAQTFTLTLTARTAGDTGGEENHAMSATELLAHTHTYSPLGTGSTGGNYPNTYINTLQSPAVSIPTGSVGGNAAMNVMQPFLACYIWKRVS